MPKYVNAHEKVKAILGRMDLVSPAENSVILDKI